MRKLIVALVAILTITLPTVPGLAEEEQMDRQKACDLLGNCGQDMIEAAKSMMAECEKMMAKAQDLMNKGKAIKGQGMLWGDEEMIADGQATYDQGKKMYDEAKAMSESCALIISAGEQMKKKYRPGSTKIDDKEKQRPGDYVP